MLVKAVFLAADDWSSSGPCNFFQGMAQIAKLSGAGGADNLTHVANEG